MNPTAATGAERLDRPWAGEATSPSASLSTQADEAQHRQCRQGHQEEQKTQQKINDPLKHQEKVLLRAWRKSPRISAAATASMPAAL